MVQNLGTKSTASRDTSHTSNSTKEIMHQLAKTILALVIATGIGAQELVAELITTKPWSMQCDPIRFTLRLQATQHDVRVRIAESKAIHWLHPFEVEREVEGQWVAIDDTGEQQKNEAGKRVSPIPQRRQLRNPATMLTGLSGKDIKQGATTDLEAGLWQLRALHLPGKIRVRARLQTRTAAPAAGWQDFVMPWTTIDIYSHGGNADGLLGKGPTDLGRRYEMICVALNRTMRQSQNHGPINLGPAGPSKLRPNSWEKHQETCRELLATSGLSNRVRARALLARIYYCLEEVHCERDHNQQLLERARQDLASPELSKAGSGYGIAALPSGGLQPLVLMLKACAADGFGQASLASRNQAYATICKANPFFAYWWRHEANDLLRH